MHFLTIGFASPLILLQRIIVLTVAAIRSHGIHAMMIAYAISLALVDICKKKERLLTERDMFLRTEMRIHHVNIPMHV